MIFVVFIIVFSTLWSLLSMWLFDDDCYWAKKRMANKIININGYQRLKNTKDITFTYKGKEFSVCIKPLQEDDKFKIISVWINEDCALIMHTLIGTFCNCRAMTYAKKRSESEICEIIKFASKTAKKRMNQDTKNYINLHCKTNSYFNNEEE